MAASPASIARALPLAAPLAAAARAEAAEQHVGERAVHGARHELRQHGAGRADHHAGDDHRRVGQHVALERDGQAGERVVQRDDDRHVGAADGQGHEHAEDQSDGR